MMVQNVELKAGELVCFSTGEYSDYSVGGHFVALCNVSNEEVLALAQSLKNEQETKDRDDDYEYGFAQNNFIGRMIRNGWLLCVDCREIHIGSYSELDLS